MQTVSVYQVKITKKASKQFVKLPEDIKRRFKVLVKALELSGPYRTEWPNYGRLKGDKTKYHCHLSDKWIACWTCPEDKLQSISIEVYYVGSRENAPY